MIVDDFDPVDPIRWLIEILETTTIVPSTFDREPIATLQR